jgi:hypothetical protein
MGWFILAQVLSIMISIMRIGRMSEQEKDLEILIMLQQLAILQRKQEKPVKTNRAEKMMLAILTAKLKAVKWWSAGQLRGILRIVQPETVLGWHRDLVRRKWSYTHRNKGGRPKMAHELEILILRFAGENPRWGYGKIEGELLKCQVSADSGSSAKRVMLSRINRWAKHSPAQQAKVSPAIHLALDHLQTIHLTFYLPIAPRIAQGGFHRSIIGS